MLLVGLYCKDHDYRKRLSEILMEKAGEQFSIYSFSEERMLLNYVNETKLDLLLIEETEYVKLKSQGLLNSISDNYIILTDDQIEDQTNHTLDHGKYPAGNYGNGEGRNRGEEVFISKYSTVAAMLQLMKSLFYVSDNTDGKVIGIGSEVHCCGKTSLAYTLAQQLQEKGNTLLLVLDYRNPVFTSSECGLSRILYELCKYSASKEYSLLEEVSCTNEHFCSLLEANVLRQDEVTFLPASSLKKEMAMIQDVHISSLIAHLRACKVYRYIVIDFSEQLLYGDSLASCDIILCPTKNDCLSAHYTRNFQSEMKAVRQVTLPLVRGGSSPEQYYRELQWTPLGGTVSHLIRELNL